MIAVVILCIVWAGVATGASAQGVGGPAAGGARAGRAVQQIQARFASANTTRDGKLTREQAAAGMPMVASHFDEIDTRHDGYVTLPQIEAFARERMAAR